MAYPTISALPTPPSRQEPATFSARADAFLGAFPTFRTETNTAGDFVETKAGEAATSATTATDAAATAVAARDTTIAAANASEWVSGASYAEGDVVWSPVDFQTYRAKTTHSSITTDPSLDATNWELISRNDLSGDIAIGGNLTVSNDTALTGNLTVSGTATIAGVTDISDDTSVAGEFIATSYNETYAAVISTANATTVNCETGNAFLHALTENTTFTFSNPPASGTAYAFTLEIVQGATARTVTWPASVEWEANEAPILTSTASAPDIFVFYTRDGGTTWYGFRAGRSMGVA